jgi:hypothetical protein
VSGLLKISSALTPVSVPRRDDPDDFFSIFLSSSIAPALAYGHAPMLNAFQHERDTFRVG